ncbi:uncharacterized protein G2W53_015492 [Senna tora]|uniref:Uncharacterized protein n=1 Tax=Senna tora TaxID=362788 RepID=A0A835C5N4_9FABA|nr:uncharacterized protein G2W53_015492 [Senna tora]
MTMVMASASNQTMAFYSSTTNSLVQRRDIQYNASDKGKQIKKHCDQHLPKFGMTDSELFKDLCSRGLMCLKPRKIWTALFTAWFRLDLTCAYHWGTLGIPSDHASSSRIMCQVTVQEWADLNEVSKQLLWYDKVSEARSISYWDSKSPSSLKLICTDFLAVAGLGSKYCFICYGKWWGQIMRKSSVVHNSEHFGRYWLTRYGEYGEYKYSL